MGALRFHRVGAQRRFLRGENRQYRISHCLAKVTLCLKRTNTTLSLLVPDPQV